MALEWLCDLPIDMTLKGYLFTDLKLKTMCL